VDYIDGLSPAVSIDQKSTSHNPRSTVGTVTEIYGLPASFVCPRRHTALPRLRAGSGQAIGAGDVEAIEKLEDATRVLILAPVVRGRKGTYQAVFEEIRKAGFVRARVDGKVVSLDDEIELDRYKQHNIDAVVDRLVINCPETEEDEKQARTRLTDSVETALKFGEGYVTVSKVESQKSSTASEGGDLQPSTFESSPDMFFSENLSCPEHGVSLTEIEPRTFSFNTPQGACQECQGLGSKLEIDRIALSTLKSR